MVMYAFMMNKLAFSEDPLSVHSGHLTDNSGDPALVLPILNIKGIELSGFFKELQEIYCSTCRYSTGEQNMCTT